MNDDLPFPHRPAGPELLRIARRSLDTVLLPALGSEHRYTALMLAHALAICEREWRAGASAGADPSAAQSLQQALRHAAPGDEVLSEATWAALWRDVQSRLVVDKGHPAGAGA